MASLVSLDGTAVKFDTHIDGDFHFLHLDRRVATIRDTTIGAGARVNIHQYAAEPRSVRKARERAERETTLIDGAHDLLVMIRDPEVSVDDRFFNEKLEQLMALVDVVQKDIPKKYYTEDDDLVLHSLRGILEYIERLDKDFAAQPEDVIEYSHKVGYRTDSAKEKFHMGGVPCTLDFIWNIYLDKHNLMLGRCQRIDRRACIIL